MLQIARLSFPFLTSPQKLQRFALRKYIFRKYFFGKYNFMNWFKIAFLQICLKFCKMICENGVIVPDGLTIQKSVSLANPLYSSMVERTLKTRQTRTDINLDTQICMIKTTATSEHLWKFKHKRMIKSIITCETSQAITPFQFINYSFITQPKDMTKHHINR